MEDSGRPAWHFPSVSHLVSVYRVKPIDNAWGASEFTHTEENGIERCSFIAPKLIRFRDVVVDLEGDVTVLLARSYDYPLLGHKARSVAGCFGMGGGS